MTLIIDVWVCPDHRDVILDPLEPVEGEAYCPRCDMDRAEDAERIWLAEVQPPADASSRER
jgi:hypothetical protein